MEPNASIASLLTISEENGERLFFAYFKQLNELAPPDVHWYPKKGRDGKAEFIWEEQRVKQWVAIGNDEAIQAIWNELKAGSLLLFKESKDPVSFLPHSITVEADDPRKVAIPELCPCSSDNFHETFILHDKKNSPFFLLGEANNCAFLEGYQLHDVIKPVFPAGLIPKGALHRYIEKSVCGIFQKRGFSYQFSEKKADGFNRLEGFIQQDLLFRNTHRLRVFSADGSTLLGEGNINEKDGKWTVPIGDNIGEGQLRVFSIEKNTDICGEKYFILQSIQIRDKYVHTIITDLYGREITLSDKEDQAFTPVANNIIWDASVAPDGKQSEIELSDRLERVLLSLGRNIVINDPYFLGEFKVEGNTLKPASRGSFIFLNALIGAIAKGSVESLSIVGKWSRAGNIMESGRENFVDNYHLLAGLVKAAFKNSSIFKLKKFELIFSQSPMHDRYWMGTPEESPVVYAVSSSISGVYENRELSIALQDEMASFKIARLITNRLTKGEKTDLM